MFWYLFGAICAEVAATLSLKAATARPRFFLIAVAGYILAFTLLSGALQHGMRIGVAYGIWTACGVAATAILSRIIFHEHLTRTMSMGIALIALGVLLVELGSG
ncbi:SMR family transporter [Corynebacterium sp. ES2794-CONJ1]|uniref:DMT family transporter n=1 Tax=unclassified Corynebacterium TaxID=2624378 RepID=UPI00216A77C8|nr:MULTISPECIES: SMR family transporter [unclassified Corynebacterium]MCS4490632.1 SMR family transporter [Corynebacterium sp. ES2775-CONJ]MCS4492433.1 SMR family transporter [Corynebacterium sp. ES2715-CONJ3]MCS4532603.1 SMR family transporter [Corynebacterium sp. ES2730-CONJ]MCU9519998.1 SMR family transporter [Corynebacterium sp. ES2794-CONJ1]